MKRSSADNPPRVGMVVRFARDADGSDTCNAAETVRGPWQESGATVCWDRGQYDIISEPAEECGEPISSSGYRCNLPPDHNVGHKWTNPDQDPYPSPAPCNCAQSLALTDALRRIVAVDRIQVVDGKAMARDPIDVLTEVNLIAREAIK